LYVLRHDGYSYLRIAESPAEDTTCAITEDFFQHDIQNTLEADWDLNTPIAFHDLLNDSNFSDMNFDTQSEYPPLNFDLPPSPNLRNYGDKVSNLLQIRSPPPTIDYSLNDGQSWSPLPNLTPSHSQFAISRPNTHLQPYETVTRDYRKSISRCIEQLSKLSLKLYEHSTTIPPASVWEGLPDADDATFAEIASSRAKNYTNYRVDETFQLTQELVDVYPSFIDLFMQRKITQLSKTHQGGESLGPISPSVATPLALDHPTILLLLSCHLRLVEIYEELLKHMKICVTHKGSLCMSEDASFAAPKVRIGNYCPPATTAVPMQMLLLLHFATSLRDSAVDLESHILALESSTSVSGKEDPMAMLSLTSAEKLKERASGMLDGIVSIRTTLLRMGRIA